MGAAQAGCIDPQAAGAAGGWGTAVRKTLARTGASVERPANGGENTGRDCVRTGGHLLGLRGALGRLRRRTHRIDCSNDGFICAPRVAVVRITPNAIDGLARQLLVTQLADLGGQFWGAQFVKLPELGFGEHVRIVRQQCPIAQALSWTCLSRLISRMSNGQNDIVTIVTVGQICLARSWTFVSNSFIGSANHTTERQMNSKQATQQGAQAYKSSKGRAPALNQAFLIAANATGNLSTLMADYIYGWDIASLADGAPADMPSAVELSALVVA